MSGALLALYLLTSAALLVHAVCVINRMNWHTNHLIRLAYILLAVGALGILVSPLFGCSTPNVADVIVNTGVAMVLIVGSHLRERKGWPQ